MVSQYVKYFYISGVKEQTNQLLTSFNTVLHQLLFTTTHSAILLSLLPVFNWSCSWSVARDGGDTSIPALLLAGAISGNAFPPPAFSLAEENWVLFQVSPK